MKKKAVIGVVVISLLLLISIISVFLIQSWFITSKSESESILSEKKLKNNFEIIKLNANTLYVENNFKDNLIVKEIKVADRTCPISNQTLKNGINKLDLGSCVIGLKEITSYPILILTNDGVVVENEILRNVIQSSLIVKYQTTSCDSSQGYIRLFGLSSLDNAHVDIDGSNPINVCIKHINYTLNTTNSVNSINLFSLTQTNNSAIWIQKSNIFKTPTNWYDVVLSSSNGTFSYSVNSSDLSSQGYACIASLIQDNIYGSHLGSCNSAKLFEKIWVKLT